MTAKPKTTRAKLDELDRKQREYERARTIARRQQRAAKSAARRVTS